MSHQKDARETQCVVSNLMRRSFLTFLHYFLYYFEVAIRSLGFVVLVEHLPVYQYTVHTYSPDDDLYA